MPHTSGSGSDSISEFIDFLFKNDIGPATSAEIRADDKIARYTVAGDKPRTKNGVYRLGLIDGVLIGWARSHKQGVSHTFKSGRYKALSAEERKQLENEMERRRADSVERQKKGHEAAAKFARNLLKTARSAAGADHSYLKKKQISGDGLYLPAEPFTWQNQNLPAATLLIPIRDIHGAVWNLQLIKPDGFKMFLDGGRIKSCFHEIGQPRPFRDDPFVICEGMATGKTLYMATGLPVKCALQANNLLAVAAALRWRHNYTRFIFAADNDRWTKRPDGTPYNPGMMYATEAASMTGGTVVTVPTWAQSDQEKKRTDFNDMAEISTLEEIRKIIIADDQKNGGQR